MKSLFLRFCCEFVNADVVKPLAQMCFYPWDTHTYQEFYIYLNAWLKIIELENSIMIKVLHKINEKLPCRHAQQLIIVTQISGHRNYFPFGCFEIQKKSIGFK